MNKKELFNKCVRDAIRIGRKYMNKYATEEEPTQQEWALALVIFQYELNSEDHYVR